MNISYQERHPHYENKLIWQIILSLTLFYLVGSSLFKRAMSRSCGTPHFPHCHHSYAWLHDPDCSHGDTETDKTCLKLENFINEERSFPQFLLLMFISLQKIRLVSMIIIAPVSKLPAFPNLLSISCSSHYVIGRIYIYNGSVIQYWRSCTPSRSIGLYFWGLRGSWAECHFLFSLVHQLCLALW